MHQARRGGIDHRAEDWAFQHALLEQLESVWNKPDEGIWEVRGEPRHFTHSKVMAWVALRSRHSRGRGLWICRARSLAGSSCATDDSRGGLLGGFDRELGSFVQSYGSKDLDASLLLLPTVGFLAGI